MSITKKGTAWETKNSLWIVLNLIILLNGLGLYYAGKKVKVKKWIKHGLIYISIMWATVIIGIIAKGSILDTISMYIFFINYIACIVQSFRIRKEYLIRLELVETRGIDELETNKLRIKIANEYATNNSKIGTAKLSATKKDEN